MPLFYRVLVYTILFSSIRMLVGGYASLFLTKHGLTIADISFLKAFQGLVIILIQIPIGILIDRHKSRYPFVLISIFLAAIWMFLTAIGSSPIYFYAAELFNGLSLAIFNAVMLPILVETYSYETGKNDYNYTLGKFFKFQNLVMAISVVLGSIFVEIDSRTVWFLASSSLFILGLFSLCTKDLQKFNFTSSVNTTRELKTSPFKNSFNFIRTENILVLFIANISLLTVFQILAQFWQIVIFDYLGQNISYALIYGLIFSVILVLQASGSYLAEKNSSLKLTILFQSIFVLITIYLATIDLNPSYKIFPIILFLLCFILFRYPSIIISALLHKNISNDIRATFDSLISTSSMLISIVVFYLIGILLNHFGNKVIIVSLAILTSISFISTLLYSFKVKYKPKNNLLIATSVE